MTYVPDLDESDLACLEKVGEVLKAHGNERRFGASLLHQHFMLGEDELLVKHYDVERRTLVTAPEQATSTTDTRSSTKQDGLSEEGFCSPLPGEAGP